MVEGQQIADGDLATERRIAEEHYAAVEGIYQHLLECLPLQKERRVCVCGDIFHKEDNSCFRKGHLEHQSFVDL